MLSMYSANPRPPGQQPSPLPAELLKIRHQVAPPHNSAYYVTGRSHVKLCVKTQDWLTLICKSHQRYPTQPLFLGIKDVKVSTELVRQLRTPLTLPDWKLGSLTGCIDALA